MSLTVKSCSITLPSITWPLSGSRGETSTQHQSITEQHTDRNQPKTLRPKVNLKCQITSSSIIIRWPGNHVFHHVATTTYIWSDNKWRYFHRKTERRENLEYCNKNYRAHHVAMKNILISSTRKYYFLCLFNKKTLILLFYTNMNSRSWSWH